MHAGGFAANDVPIAEVRLRAAIQVTKMLSCSTVIPFSSRRELAERERRRDIDLGDLAQHEAVGSIALLVGRVGHAQQGIALRAALHDVLARLHARGEFDNGEILGQIEEIARAAIPNLRAPIF